uniref:DRBM domain-containing protein n=1 Tax=Lygus hesperus TaxID=30085 RepID=A0A146LM17_LYGHE
MSAITEHQEEHKEAQERELKKNGTSSPISILHEIFSGESLRPSFSFTVQHDSQQTHALLWHCTVEVPHHGIGSGVCFSKKNAKSKACVNILDQLGYDVSKFKDSDLSFNNNTPNDATVETSIIEENVDSKCKLGRCFNSCCMLNLKSDPNGELEPQFFRLYLAATSKDIRTKYAASREQNPCGYLEMLCKKIDCEPPSFSYEFKDVAFVTIVKLGPWTASGSAPSKKHSKYVASLSLIAGIEEHGKQH